jgi:hypothetical protein
MPRKMMHSLSALGIALSLLIVGLIACLPTEGSTGAFQGLGDTAKSMEAGSDTAQPPGKTYKRNRRAQAREAMALPFFSFAQGLRHGKGS